MKKSMFWHLLICCLILGMMITMIPMAMAAEGAVVVHYDFADGTAADSSGNHYDGTLVNGAVVKNGMVTMTGGKQTASTGIDIPNAALKGLTNYTLELDVILTKTENWTQLFTMGDGSNYIVMANQGNPSNVQVGFTVSGKLNGGTEERAKSSSPTVKLPVNELARATYTQSGNTATLYINGEKVGSGTVSTTLGELADKGLSASIGRSLMFGDPGMVGSVDEFVLYNYAMTDAQVQDSYNKKFNAPSQESQEPILYYNFEDVDGATVKDLSGNGYDATLKSGATVVDSLDGKGLSLSSAQDYLEMPNFLTDLKDVTFSGFVKLDKTENWTTLFSAGVQGGKCITWAVQGNPAGNNVGYTLAIHNGSVEQRVSATTEHAIQANEWVHFVYAQSGSSARLYLDGVRVDSLSMQTNQFITHGDNMTNTFSDVAGVGTISLGKSVWPDPDAYGQFDEIKVYNRCLSEAEIKELGNAFYIKADYELLDLGDLSRVTENLTLPTKGQKGSVITWKSNNPQVMDDTGAILPGVTGEHQVELTATLSLNGKVLEKKFIVTVKPYTQEELAQMKLDEKADFINRSVDFLLNDGYTLPTCEGAEVVYEIVSGEAVITDGKLCKTEKSAERQSVTLKATITVDDMTKEITLDHITVLDPYVGYILSFFGANGTVDEVHAGVNNPDEKFRMAYSYDGIHWAELNHNYPVVYPTLGETKRVRDPFVMRNKDGSFTVMATQGWDTPYIYMWQSENLTEFTDERLLKASEKGVEGLTGSRAWAPEADYDRITDQYYIYWADPSAGPIYYNTSTDLQTLSKPAVYFDPGYAVIDSNIVKDGDTYYMAFKDERASGKAMKMASSKSLEANTWEVYTDNFVTGHNSEGPFIFQDINDGKWIMYYDFFYATGDRFGYSFTDDLSTGQWEYQGTNPYMPSNDVRHGGAIPVTQKELDAILAKWETETQRNVVEIAEAEATCEGPLGFETLTLPQNVSVYLDNGKTELLPVVWNGETYEMKLGEQTLTGTVVLPEGYTNTKDVKATLTLTIKPEKNAPQFIGVEDGGVYCQSCYITVEDNNLDAVTVNGEVVQLQKGRFQAMPGELTIKATDLAGNCTTISIVINEDHSFTDDVKQPTCTAGGYTEHVCEVCGYSYISDMTDATGHKFEPVVTEPTHKTMGFTTHICACGYSYIDTYTEALEHEYTQEITTQPTCTTEGVMTFTCECGEGYTMTLPKAEHDCAVIVVEPGCETFGYTKHSCKNCDYSYISDIRQPVCHSEKFADVAQHAWYHDAVNFMVKNGYMNGVSNTEFDVEGSVTRGQLVTILYRIAGEPAVEGLDNPFTDVAEGSWYTDAILWAAKEGIVKGVSATEFDSDAEITREQIVVILYRYAGAEKDETDNLKAFTDVKSISEYALEAMNWAVGKGLVNGMTETTIEPTGTATRGQICAIVQRFLEK